MPIPEHAHSPEPAPRAELDAAIQQSLAARGVPDAAERAARVRHLADAIGCSVQLARGILAGRRSLTTEHIQALTRRRGRRPPLLSLEAARNVCAAEQAREKEDRRGRPLSLASAELAMRRTEAIARRHDEPELADRVQQLRERLTRPGAVFPVNP